MQKHGSPVAKREEGLGENIRDHPVDEGLQNLTEFFETIDSSGAMAG